MTFGVGPSYPDHTYPATFRKKWVNIANKRQANYTADTPITLYLPRNHLAITRASVNTFWRTYSAWNIQNSYRRVPRMILNPTPRIPSCHHHKSLDIIKVPPLVSHPILALPRSGWVMWAHLGRRYEPKPPPRRHGGTNERCVSYEFPRWVFGDLWFLASERANLKSQL